MNYIIPTHCPFCNQKLYSNIGVADSLFSKSILRCPSCTVKGYFQFQMNFNPIDESLEDIMLVSHTGLRIHINIPKKQTHIFEPLKDTKNNCYVQQFITTLNCLLKINPQDLNDIQRQFKLISTFS